MTRNILIGALAIAAASAAAPLALAQAQAPTQQQQAQTFTDAQVSAFAAASVEVNPISTRLTNATEAQRTQGAAQIRTILARHSLDSATYNAIATQAQSDETLAARIAAAHSAQPSHSSAH